MTIILGYVILASKDVLGVLMQFFSNHMLVICCLKCMKSYLREREEGGAELLFVPQNCNQRKKINKI